MSTIKVEAGDFRAGKYSKYVSTFGANMFLMAINEMGWTGFKTIKYPVSQIEELTEASEENVKRFWGTAGWGVAGGLLLGPVGLLAGLISGGRGKSITFVCKFKDGKKFLGTTDSKTFLKIRAALF